MHGYYRDEKILFYTFYLASLLAERFKICVRKAADLLSAMKQKSSLFFVYAADMSYLYLVYYKQKNEREV